jgi:tetratricopeptide (TPR) repeat protein
LEKGSQLQTSASQGDEAISRARALLKDSNWEGCLSELRPFWLANPDSAEAVQLCAEIMDQVNRAEAAQAMTRLAEALAGGKTDDERELAEHPTAAFEAGYHLIDSREYELAIMLMSSCLAKDPLDSTLNYELGFAYMAVSNYEQAIQHFEVSRKSQNDFDTTLNLSVCYTLSRKLKEARDTVAVLKTQASTEEEKHELRHREIVLKRLDQLQKKKQLTERDWLYALYGSVELEPSDGPANGTGSEKESYKSIAATLVILKGVLEGLQLKPEAVEFYNPNSRPLAAVLARLLEVQLDSYRGPDRPDHALLVMEWATDIIGPHEAFVGNMPNRSMFAFGLTKQEALPVIPDIVARFTNRLTFPWTERDGLPPDVAPEEAIPEILERAWNLESDPEILRIVQSTVEYYNDKRALMVLANCAQFPQRPEYSAEVPNSRQV